MTGSANVELAFKSDYLEEVIAFKWWVWSGYGGYSPDLFKLHDFYSHEQAGDTNEGMDFFPIKEVFAMDSSCANMWGASPNPADPDFCFDLDEPDDDTCLLLKCCIPFLPCKIPGDKPGDDPCVLPFKEWFILIWKPAHLGETVPDEEDLWYEYLIYLKKPFCPPEVLVTPTPTHTPTFTLEPTPTFTLIPTDTPTPTFTLTPTATKYIPPPPVCKKAYSKKKCLETGGTWIVPPLPAPGGPAPPPYCQCP
jgi:hypothetical protein